jgi:hypothetical protein
VSLTGLKRTHPHDWESGPFRVLRRQTNRLGSGLEAQVPAPKITEQLLIEHSSPDRQQLVGSRGGPTHLLLLHKPLADNLVDGRLDEAGRDGFAVPLAVRIVWDRGEVKFINSSSLSCTSWGCSDSVPTSHVRSSSVCSARCGLPCQRQAFAHRKIRRHSSICFAGSCSSDGSAGRQEVISSDLRSQNSRLIRTRQSIISVNETYCPI